MSRGMSFEFTKREKDAENRRLRVKTATLALLEGVVSVSAGDVYLALDHRVHPAISPANSGNILALLSREGVLVSVSASVYTLPPRRVVSLPVSKIDGMAPLTREMLTGGRSPVRRHEYVSQMPTQVEMTEMRRVAHERAAAPATHVRVPMAERMRRVAEVLVEAISQDVLA